MFAGLPALYLLVWIGVIAGIMVVVGYLASRILPGEASDFILEIPPLRVPQISNVMIKTLARIEWYLKEAVPLFILGTLILFLLHQTNGLTLVEWGLSPLITHFLGLPVKVTEAFIIGFLRRDYGAAGLFILAKTGRTQSPSNPRGSGDDDPLHPLHRPILHDDQGEGIPERLSGSQAVVFPVAFGVGGLLNFVMKWLGV